MSLKNLTNPEKNVVEFEFSADKETFEVAVAKVFKKKAAQINVPGFRKGKAPRSIIEKMYGKGVFYEDAVNEILPDAYESAIKDCGLEFVSMPEFDIVSIDDNGVVFKARVYTKPEVEIKDYKGIEATKKPVSVNDDDINAEIEQKRLQASRLIDITDRAVQSGDTVDIDYEGSVDGVPFDGGKAEHQSLVIGSGSFIPGFEDQIIGKNIGDEFDINVTFPTEYHANELAGKAAVFKIKLHGIKFNEMPEVDDEFAKDNGFDTLDEYKADIKARITDRREKEADADVDEEIVAALIEKLEGDIPEPMFAAEAENMLRDYDNRLRMQGLDLNTYFKYTGMTLDSMRAQFKPQAERQVRTRLALEKIAEVEKLEATAEEIAEEYDRIAKAYNMEAEKVKELVDEKGIAADMKVKKAFDLVKANAKITAKKAAAKKTTTKKAETAEDKPAAEKKTAAKKTTTAKKTETPAEEKKTTVKKTATAKKSETAEKKPAAKKATTAKKAATKKDEGDKA
ncbi:MAG: trigger factor [Ruminococcaceae bacterium]|nr:trigger factor [Oscillospiraceae bacterium]